MTARPVAPCHPRALGWQKRSPRGFSLLIWGPFLKAWPNLEVAGFIEAKLCTWPGWREICFPHGCRPSSRRGLPRLRGEWRVSVPLLWPRVDTSGWWKCRAAPSPENQMFPTRVGIVPRSGVARALFQVPRCNRVVAPFLNPL